MITLKDIAAKAGVSPMTVSNVVNGNMTKVSEKTAKKIQDIIHEMNYIPNLSARSLVKSNSNIIIIILRGKVGENSLESPHNATVVGKIIQKIQNLGFHAMVSIADDIEKISHSLLTWNAQGAIFLGMFDDEIEIIFRSNDVPRVFIDSYSDARQLSNVGINDYKGGQLAAQYLIRQGHQKIAFVGPSVNYKGVMQQRYLGFCDELKSNNIAINENLHFIIPSDIESEQIVELGKQLANSKIQPTSIFVTSDQVAVYIVQGLRLAGKDIPKDFSIISFDNLPISEQISPRLTTISQNLEQKASLAVDILVRKMQHPNSPAESLVLDVALIERDSVTPIK